MIEKVNKVRNGINKALYCDNTLEGCSDCPYTMDCVPMEMINVPRNMLLDAGKVLSHYWETLQPGYKTNAEIELEKIITEYKDRLTRFAHLTYIHVGTEDKWICSNCDNPIFETGYSYCPHCGARFV